MVQWPAHGNSHWERQAMVQALQVQSSVLDGVLLWVSGLSSLK